MPRYTTSANFFSILMILIDIAIIQIKMVKFQFTKIVDVDRDLIFEISTNYKNFTKILPKYFKNLEIVESNSNKTIIKETVNFLNRTDTILTEHIIVKPDQHVVTLLDGPAKDSCFDEIYKKNGTKTKIVINVNFILHGKLKIVGFFTKKKIQTHMEQVMNEFVNYAKNNKSN